MNTTIWGLLILSELYRQDGQEKASKFTLGMVVVSLVVAFIDLII